MSDDFQESGFENFVILVQLVDQDGVYEKLANGIDQAGRQVALRKPEN